MMNKISTMKYTRTYMKAAEQCCKTKEALN